MRHAIAPPLPEKHSAANQPIVPLAANRSAGFSGIVPLSTGYDSGLCRIQAVSDEGLKLLTSLPLEPEDPVTLSLSTGVTLAGVVVWVQQFRAGIRFDEPINSSALLHMLGGTRQAALQGG